MILGFKTALQTNVFFEHEKGTKNNLIFLNYHLHGSFLKGKKVLCLIDRGYINVQHYAIFTQAPMPPVILV